MDHISQNQGLKRLLSMMSEISHLRHATLTGEREETLAAKTSMAAEIRSTQSLATAFEGVKRATSIPFSAER